MATIVVIDAHEGSLDRYEIGGTEARKTHACTVGEPISFTAKVVEDFRLMPPDEFKVDPGPRPTSPPAGAGTVRQAA